MAPSARRRRPSPPLLVQIPRMIDIASLEDLWSDIAAEVPMLASPDGSSTPVRWDLLEEPSTANRRQVVEEAEKPLKEEDVHEHLKGVFGRKREWEKREVKNKFQVAIGRATARADDLAKEQHKSDQKEMLSRAGAALKAAARRRAHDSERTSGRSKEGLAKQRPKMVKEDVLERAGAALKAAVDRRTHDKEHILEGRKIDAAKETDAVKDMIERAGAALKAAVDRRAQDTDQSTVAGDSALGSETSSTSSTNWPAIATDSNSASGEEEHVTASVLQAQIKLATQAAKQRRFAEAEALRTAGEGIQKAAAEAWQRREALSREAKVVAEAATNGGHGWGGSANADADVLHGPAAVEDGSVGPDIGLRGVWQSVNHESDMGSSGVWHVAGRESDAGASGVWQAIPQPATVQQQWQFSSPSTVAGTADASVGPAGTVVVQQSPMPTAIGPISPITPVQIPALAPIGIIGPTSHVNAAASMGTIIGTMNAIATAAAVAAASAAFTCVQPVMLPSQSTVLQLAQATVGTEASAAQSFNAPATQINAAPLPQWSQSAAEGTETWQNQGVWNPSNFVTGDASVRTCSRAEVPSLAQSIWPQMSLQDDSKALYGQTLCQVMPEFGGC